MYIVTQAKNILMLLENVNNGSHPQRVELLSRNVYHICVFQIIYIFLGYRWHFSHLFREVSAVSQMS